MFEPKRKRHVYPKPTATLTLRSKTGHGTVRIILDDTTRDTGSADGVTEFNHNDDVFQYHIKESMPCHLRELFSNK